MREHGVELRALAVDGGDGIAAAVIYRVNQGTVIALQVAAVDEASAERVFRAAAAGGAGLRLANLPSDDQLSGVLAELGAEVAVRQHEMLLRLA